MKKREKEGMDQKKTEENKQNFMIKLASFIVDKRNLFFLIFALAIIFSLVSKNWVSVENSLSAYLPDTSETGSDGRKLYHLWNCTGHGGQHFL